MNADQRSAQSAGRPAPRPSVPPGKSDSRGATAVEMALVLPVVILFIMGIFDVANMMRISLGMQHAVRMGAAMAASGEGVDTGTRSLSLITTEVKGELAGLGEQVEQGAVVTVKSWPGSVSSGDGATGDLGGPCDTVEVRVDYDYPTLEAFNAAMGLFGGSVPTTIALSRAEKRLNEPWATCN